MVPETFRQDVKVNLQHAGNWKIDPNLVMDTVVVEAEEWRKIEAFSQSSTSTPHSRQHGSKSAGSSAKWECYRCGQRGHIARNCMAPSPVASVGEQGQSSAARQQRPPHKGNNRGHRGAGGGGSSEGSSSWSTSDQEQHQTSKNNPGSSGSGSGGAAPQRTVQVDASSTTASAPVAAPAVPSAAAPGPMPAAAPGVSLVSDAWKLSPWSAGWSAYPPVVPFEYSRASPPAQLARPWSQVGMAAPRKCRWSLRTSMFPQSCVFLANARGEPLHFET